MKRTLAIVLVIALAVCVLPMAAMAADCSHANAYKQEGTAAAWGMECWYCPDCGAASWGGPFAHVHTMDSKCAATAQLWGMAICADCGEWYSVR